MRSPMTAEESLSAPTNASMRRIHSHAHLRRQSRQQPSRRAASRVRRKLLPIGGPIKQASHHRDEAHGIAAAGIPARSRPLEGANSKLSSAIKNPADASLGGTCRNAALPKSVRVRLDAVPTRTFRRRRSQCATPKWCMSDQRQRGDGRADK